MKNTEDADDQGAAVRRAIDELAEHAAAFERAQARSRELIEQMCALLGVRPPSGRAGRSR